MLELLGTAQLRAGETNNAVATYTKLVTLIPKCPDGALWATTALVASKATEPATASLLQGAVAKADYLPAEIMLASVQDLAPAMVRKR